MAMLDRTVRCLSALGAFMLRLSKRTQLIGGFAMGPLFSGVLLTFAVNSPTANVTAPRKPARSAAAVPIIVAAQSKLDLMRNEAASGDEFSNWALSTALMDKFDLTGDSDDLYEAMVWVDRRGMRLATRSWPSVFGAVLRAPRGALALVLRSGRIVSSCDRSGSRAADRRLREAQPERLRKVPQKSAQPLRRSVSTQLVRLGRERTRDHSRASTSLPCCGAVAVERAGGEADRRLADVAVVQPGGRLLAQHVGLGQIAATSAAPCSSARAPR